MIDPDIKNQQRDFKRANRFSPLLTKNDHSPANKSISGKIPIESQLKVSGSFLEVTNAQLANTSLMFDKNSETELLQQTNTDEKQFQNEKCLNETNKIVDSFNSPGIKDTKDCISESNSVHTKSKEVLFKTIDYTDTRQVEPIQSVDNMLAQEKCHLSQQSSSSMKTNEANFDLKKEFSEWIGNCSKYTQNVSEPVLKSYRNEERYMSCSTKLDSLEMSDKISSAVDSLMSLKNLQKLDDTCNSLINQRRKIVNDAEVEEKQKSSQEYSAHLFEVKCKYSDSNEIPKVQFQELDKHVTNLEPIGKPSMVQESELKRVSVRESDSKCAINQENDMKRSTYTPHEPDMRRMTQIHESDAKRVTIQEPEVKRVMVQEPEVMKRVQIQDVKPKPSHVLKGCLNPKSMLKPGTLIDIAGISHSPEIMTPLRPGSDGEIIPMNKPIVNDLIFANKVTPKPYEPRTESNVFAYNRWQPLTPEKNNIKSDQVTEKETLDSKSRLNVNESAWRQAFKNVREPKSSNNSPVEKPVVKKQLSVTALAKRHSKSKSETSPVNNPQPSIPFLRQNKPFLGSASPNKPQSETTRNLPDAIKSDTDIDFDRLREKEAEVEEFVRQYMSAGMKRPLTDIHGRTENVSEQHFVSDSNLNRISSLPDDKKCTNITQHDQGYESATNKQAKKLLKPSGNQQSKIEQNEVSLFSANSSKRSSSPYHKFSPLSSELTTDAANKMNTSDISNSPQNNTKSNLNSCGVKQEQVLNIFQDSTKRPISPKLQTKKAIEINPDGGSNKLSQMALQFCMSSSRNVSKEDMSKASPQQVTASDNIFKQIQPGRRLNSSPTPSHPFTNPPSDSLFKDCGSAKRTKSPTFLSSYPHRSSPSSTPQKGSPKRNSNSPVPVTCTNVFKDSKSSSRSNSPSSPTSTYQNRGDTAPNVFSQNMGFKRSISPLCYKSDVLAANSVPKSENSDIKSTNLKRIENYSEDFYKKDLLSQSKMVKSECTTKTTAGSKCVEQNQSTASNVELPQVSDEQLMRKNDSVKKEGTEFSTAISASEGHVKIKTNRQNMVPNLGSQGSDFQKSGSPDKEEIRSTFGGASEAKHRLPLTVEHTLKQLRQVRTSNKKTPVKTADNIQVSGSSGNKDNITFEVFKDDNEDKQNVVKSKLSTGIYSHTQEEELDLMIKKKVNMSSEEIKRWLNDSSNSGIEHSEGCGVLENSVCECEYRNTLQKTQQKIESPKQESFVKADEVKSNTFDSAQLNINTKQDEEINTTGFAENKILPLETFAVQQSYASVLGNESLNSLEAANKLKTCSNAFNITNSESKQEVRDVSSEKQRNHPKRVPPSLVHLPNRDKCSDNDESKLESPPANKNRTFKLVQKNDNDQETDGLLPHLRDDVSSSNDISSSNDETPEKSLHSERRSIFQQRRSALKVKERRELLSPSVKAFSPENESSVYAFEPDLPPASTPFRRSKGKEGKPNNATTDEDDQAPSSNSIAVQVNFDNEAVLECSTQTDVQEGDDDDMHTFYIPLQQSSADTTKPPLIQGVAVKVDTEGPDQKVIMRAKLVTKPLSTFSRTSSTPARALIGSRSGKPEQKVRPLSVKPPVGTVQPTARPKPSPQTEPATPSTSKTCSPQAARLAKRSKAKGATPSTSHVDVHPPKPPPPSKVAPAKLVEAPTFYPTEKEFEDPLEYIDSITPMAEKFGLCRVVPPSNFKPECKVSDDMRFTAYNQYIHKMLHRWGPNVKEMLAIKKYLATQSIALTQPPWIGGMEVDLPRLYQTVQQCGGLKEVIEKKRWHRVADTMKIPKLAQDRVTKLDDIYCKFLLPYDTLSHAERTQLFEEVEKDWIEREKRVDNSQDDNDDDEDDSDSDSDIDECIVKGRSMALNAFYRIARNTMSMWFSKTDNPAASDVELEFWRHVASRQHHVCVHSGSIDSGAMGYGFPTGKNSSTSRHPWNLKVLTNNPGSILRYLSPVIGVTVPTLHVGMLFSACCWYRDPHGLPWIEYLHTGASKIWYGIPDSSSAQFRTAVMDLVPRLCRDKKIWLASDTAMVPPPLLVERGVSLSRIVQDPGQFIIVFPKAFTSSVCTGYVVSESVYFAQPSWIATAQNLFNDMRESCEPTVFSLEKLLFNIVNDSRSTVEVLNQILPIVVSLRDGEIAGRRQLEELGLNSSERLNTNKRRKNRPANEEEEDYECDDCRTNLFISFVSNSHDKSVYCLPHAVELLTHKRNQVKHCTLLYAFSEDELEELVEKLKSRVENKNQKKVQTKSIKS